MCRRGSGLVGDVISGKVDPVGEGLVRTVVALVDMFVARDCGKEGFLRKFVSFEFQRSFSGVL